MNENDFDLDFGEFNSDYESYDFLNNDPVAEQLELYLNLVPEGRVKERLINKIGSGYETEVLNFLWYLAEIDVETTDSVMKYMESCPDKVFWEVTLYTSQNIPTTAQLENWWSS